MPECPNEAVIAAPFGALALYANAKAVLKIDVVAGSAELIKPSTPLLEEACRQFNAYFENPLWRFSLPLMTRGTEHAQRVWRALQAVRPGQIKSYGELARELGTGARAVAGACRGNAFPIVIPCHRVVARNGLGGYCGRRSGPALGIKRWLLRHEGIDLAGYA